jgi:hypothetical protein
MATILSLAMLLRHSLGLEAEAARIEAAVAKTLADGIRGGDLGGDASTSAIGDAVLESFKFGQLRPAVLNKVWALDQVFRGRYPATCRMGESGAPPDRSAFKARELCDCNSPSFCPR